MISQRTEAFIAVVVSAAATSTFPWNRSLGLFGAVMLIFSVFSLVRGLRRSKAHRAQERPIRQLYRMVRRLPRGRVGQDPVTGAQFAVERRRGFLTMVVSDPPGPEATATRYRIAWLGFYAPPPMLKHIAPLADADAANMGMARMAVMDAVNRQAGGMLEVTVDELDDLQAALGRAMRFG